MKTIKPPKQGLYHKQSRLHWHAVAFEGRDGEPFLIAATTAGRAISLAKYHIYDITNVVAEPISISRRAINLTTKQQ